MECSSRQGCLLHNYSMTTQVAHAMSPPPGATSARRAWPTRPAPHRLRAKVEPQPVLRRWRGVDRCRVSRPVGVGRFAFVLHALAEPVDDAGDEASAHVLRPSASSGAVLRAATGRRARSVATRRGQGRSSTADRRLYGGCDLSAVSYLWTTRSSRCHQIFRKP